MLTKGFQDEQQKKLDQILKSGFKLEFVPDGWDGNQRQKLDNIIQKGIDISLDQIIRFTPGKLLETLKAKGFNFSNYENLADLLLKTAPLEKEDQSNLAQKALAIYEYTQEESQTFSFGLMQKMDKARKIK